MKFIVEVLMGVCSLAYSLASYFSHGVLGSFQTVRAKTFYSNTVAVGLGVLTLNFLHRYLGVGVGVGVDPSTRPFTSRVHNYLSNNDDFFFPLQYSP